MSQMTSVKEDQSLVTRRRLEYMGTEGEKEAQWWGLGAAEGPWRKVRRAAGVGRVSCSLESLKGCSGSFPEPLLSGDEIVESGTRASPKSVLIMHVRELINRVPAASSRELGW